jgi:hypothetical protein
MTNIKQTRREERNDIISEIGGSPSITGGTEMNKMRALNSLIEDLEDSVNKHSQSTNKLSTILVIATVVLALVGVTDIYFKVRSVCGTTPFQTPCNLTK